MTAKEKREAVVALIRTRIKKNRYTQGSKRDQVFDEPTGWGDCSSTVRAVYKKALGINIGSNTVDQITSKKGTDVDVANGRAYPDEDKLLPGDCLYFKGTDTSRPFAVGHVEMYIGNGKIIGHGSGIGPTVKNMKTYCKSRKSSDRGYIKARRFIVDNDAAIDDETIDGGIVPANPAQTITDNPAVNGTVTVTGEQVNLRGGPSTDFDIVRIVPCDTKLAKITFDGWIPVLFDGEVVWVSGKYVE